MTARPLPSTSVAILVGGHSRRMGVDKARLRLGAGTVLERVIGAATPMGLPLSLVCASPSEEADERLKWLRSFDLPVIPDLHPDRGPLGGLHTALSSSGADRLLLLACDLPFLTTPFLSYILSMQGTADVALPQDEHGLHPLCAVYADSCLRGLSNCLDESRLSLIDFVRSVSYKPLGPSDYADLDPDGLLTTNLNTMEDCERARGLLEQQNLS